MAQTDDEVQELLRRGPRGFWVTAAGEVWPVPRHAWHSHTLEEHNMARAYVDAYAAGMVRIGLSLHTVYVSYGHKVASTALQEAMRLLLHPKIGDHVPGLPENTSHPRNNFYIEQEEDYDFSQNEITHPGRVLPNVDFKTALSSLKRAYNVARRRELQEKAS